MTYIVQQLFRGSERVVLIVAFRQVYKRKTEAAKKEYLKALAAYRASLVSKVSRCRGAGL